MSDIVADIYYLTSFDMFNADINHVKNSRSVIVKYLRHDMAIASCRWNHMMSFDTKQLYRVRDVSL